MRFRRWAALRWRVRLAAGHPSWWLALLGGVLVLAVVAATSAGSVPIAWSELASAWSDPTHPAHGVLVRVRLPRVVGAVEVGAALGVAGLLLQTALRNPLADAGLLGVSAGAGFAAMVVLVLAPAAAALVPLAAFAGGLAALGVLVTLASLAAARLTPQTLLLAGVALQAILFAGVAVLTLLFADRAPAFVAFSVGSLATTLWREVLWGLPMVVLGLGGTFAATRLLDMMLFDDASAAGLGVSLPRARLLVALLAAVLCAAAVALAGLVGFVGLLVPNGLRLLLGSRHVVLVPATALGGAALVVLADLGARTVVAPIELPVGAVMALVGGPFFLFLLLRRGGVSGG